MESMGEADGVAVCDTGSTDGTANKLRSLGAQVYHILIDPWRFDTARNVSLDLVPADADICVCTDLDEVLESGWREKLERVWTAGVTHVRYMYTWRFNEDGTRGQTFWYEKIHSRRGYRWVHPVHEVLRYSGDVPEIWAHAADIQLDHYPDPAKSRGSYLSLLELSHRENPADNATAFWLGREYMFHGQHDRAIATLQEHLNMPGGWDQERCASMRYIASAFRPKATVRGRRGGCCARSPNTPHRAIRTWSWRGWDTCFPTGRSRIIWWRRRCASPKSRYRTFPRRRAGAIRLMISARSRATASAFTSARGSLRRRHAR
jgi:hypothetical protein